MNQNDNLSLSRQVETLSAYIQNISSNDVSTLQRQSKAKIDREIEQGYDQIQQIEKKILDVMKNKADQAMIEAKANFLYKHKIEWLNKRDELLNQVFQLVDHKFQDFILTEEYADGLLKLIAEAIEKIQSDQIELRFDEYSDRLINDEQLIEIAKQTGRDLRRGDTFANNYGVLAASIDGRLSYDNTLKARLERKKPELRVLASQCLFEVNNG